jgi:hypothetical protein
LDQPFERLSEGIAPLPSVVDKAVTVGTPYSYHVRGVSFFYTPGNSEPLILQSLPSDPATDAAGKLKLALRPAYARPGTVLQIQVSMELSTNVGGEGMLLRIGYDPALLQPRIQPRAVLVTGLTKSLVFTDNAATATGELRLTGSGGFMRPGSGAIFTLQFDVSPTAPNNSILALSLLEAGFKDQAGRVLATEILPQGSPATGAFFIPGDVDGNGLVQNTDYTLLNSLTQPKARPPTNNEFRAGDLNGDGRLDSSDLVLLKRVLEGKPLFPTL